MNRVDVQAALAEHRPESRTEWLTEHVLRVDAFSDERGRHPSFVINFLHPTDAEPEFTNLRFGTKFYMPQPVSLDWINKQNSELRFARLFWDEDGLAVVLDVYAPSRMLEPAVFRANYSLFGIVLTMIAAMASPLKNEE